MIKKSHAGRNISWLDYVVALSNRFGKLIDDPLGDLVNLKQANLSVEEYLDLFEGTLIPLDLAENQALRIFLTNMNPHPALHVRQFKPVTISDAARIAKLHESALTVTPPKYSRAPFYSAKTSAPPSYAQPLLPSPDTNTKPLQRPPPIKHNTDPKPTLKLTYEEMQNRRAKGLCMFCDELFTPGHQLKHKRAQIYVWRIRV